MQPAAQPISIRPAVIAEARGFREVLWLAFEPYREGYTLPAPRARVRSERNRERSHVTTDRQCPGEVAAHSGWRVSHPSSREPGLQPRVLPDTPGLRGAVAQRDSRVGATGPCRHHALSGRSRARRHLDMDRRQRRAWD